MIGLKRGTVKLMRYNPKWRLIALRDINTLKKALGKIALDIQHIGSTAIPGMNAKPIIDINVAIKALKSTKDLIEPLKKLGYRYHGGEPKKKLFIKESNGKVTRHLHILELDSRIWNNDLLFRDFLHKNKKEAQRYAELKGKFAERFYDDRESYSDAKNSFIETIIIKAKDSCGHRNKLKKRHKQ